MNRISGILLRMAADFRFALRFGIRAFVRPGDFHLLPAQLRGAILGIGLSIVPLLAVIVISNGMIDGITRRLMEVSTYHIQVSFPGIPSNNSGQKTLDKTIGKTIEEISAIDGVAGVYLERDGLVQLRFESSISGTSLRCIPSELFSKDEGFSKYVKLADGHSPVPGLPARIKASVFEERIMRRAGSDERRALSGAYALESAIGAYSLINGLGEKALKSASNAFTSTGMNAIFLGKALAEKINAVPGDMIYILSFYEFRSRIVAKSARAVVSSVFSTGYEHIDQLLALIPYEMGIRIIQKQSSKEFLGVKVDDPFIGLKEKIADIRRIIDNSPFPAEVQSWYELSINQYRSFELTKMLLVFIMVLIVIVAAANIYSSIVMIVMDRTFEIAILKSMGAKPRVITLSFLLTGFYAGASGAIIGMIIGLLIAVNINEVFKVAEYFVNISMKIIIALLSPLLQLKQPDEFLILNPEYYLEKIPIKMSIEELVFVPCITIFLSVLFAFIPARNAGRIRPLEIIRKY